MSGIWLFLSNILFYTWGFMVARCSKGKKIKELEKEKEDLQKRFNCLLEAHKICDEDNERLNNITTKLEEWLKEKQKLTCGRGITLEYKYAFEDCLDKLEELKGSGKE